MGLTLPSASSLLGLLLLQGITGMFFGLLISTYKHRRDQVIQIGMSAVLPSLILSGTLWPREGMPEGMPLILQSIRWCWRSPVFCVKFTVTDITALKKLFVSPQCTRTDLNKRFLPKPMTTTG